MLLEVLAILTEVFRDFPPSPELNFVVVLEIGYSHFQVLTVLLSMIIPFISTLYRNSGCNELIARRFQSVCSILAFDLILLFLEVESKQRQCFD
jgi:hypothetical protein